MKTNGGNGGYHRKSKVTKTPPARTPKPAASKGGSFARRAQNGTMQNGKK